LRQSPIGLIPSQVASLSGKVSIQYKQVTNPKTATGVEKYEVSAVADEPARRNASGQNVLQTNLGGRSA